MAWSLILSFCLMSCGSMNKEESKFIYSIETEELETYIDRFEELSVGRNEKHITALVVKFDDLEAPVSGLCKLYTKSSPVISVDRAFWARADADARENLIFHELGHCILRRGHLDKRNNFKPQSIMYPRLITGYYKKDKENYIDELFSVEGDWFHLVNQDVIFICGEDHGF